MNTNLLYVSLRHFSPLIISAVAAGTLCLGCESKQLLAKQQEKIIQESELLNAAYLQGDVNRARLSLQQNAQLLEESIILEPIGRAQLLSYTYFRLYVLEKRAGKVAAADASLVKAQYWVLKNGELLQVDIEEAVAEIKQFSSERIVEYVDDRDRRLNNGRPPQYARAIQESNAPVTE